MNIVRNVTTYDAPIDIYGRIAAYRPAFSNVRAHGYHGDDMLNAVPVGKVLVSGRTWQGDLQPIVDATVAAVKSFTTPFVPPGVLNAEPSPTSLNLGRTWVGNLEKQITSSHDAAGNVDASELLIALSHLHNALAGGSKTGAQMKDALRRVQIARDGIVSALVGGIGRAASAVGGFVKGAGQAVSGAAHMLKPAGPGGGSGGESGESEDALSNATQMSALQHAGAGMGMHADVVNNMTRMNLNTTAQIGAMDRANKEFWCARLGTTSDATAERDSQHAIRTATTEAARLRAMNVANRLHATKCSKTQTGDTVLSSQWRRRPYSK